jgi:pimeloyl-ACP methyl ester carboxylesterase
MGVGSRLLHVCDAARRPQWRLVGLPLALLLVVSGALVSPTPAAALTDAPAVVIPARYLDQQVFWSECDFDEAFHYEAPEAPETDCTQILVPMDWRHPDAHPDITLAIAYSRATGTSKGLLTTNPGGPGEPAMDFTAFLSLFNQRLFTDYDLLGFDPRGYSKDQQTTPGTMVSCYTTQSALDRLPLVPDSRLRNPKTHQAEIAAAKLVGQACSSTELSQFVSTQQTVFDLEFLRRFLGQTAPRYDKLNYIGYSYGSWLGAWYADTYPSHTGRFILDSNMNWTASMQANQATDSFSFQRRRDLMFFPWLARRNKTYHLGNTTTKVAKRYEQIRTNIGRAFARGDLGTSATDVDIITANQLYADASFADAASTLNDFEIFAGANADAAVSRRIAARVGSFGGQDASSLVRRARERLRHDRAAGRVGVTAEEPVEIDGASEIVRCNDSAYSRDVASALKRADADRKKFPFIGYTNTVSDCAYWKFAPVSRTVALTGVPRMLMLQSEGDPATAYEGAVAAHRRSADHTRLVSVDNEGQHGLYIDGPSPCVEGFGDAFLFSGVLPDADQICTTSPLPGDSRVYRLNGPVDGNSYAIDARTRPPKTAVRPSGLVLRRAEAARHWLG